MHAQTPTTADETDEQPENCDSKTALSLPRSAVEEAADRLEAEDEPLTVSRLAGTTLQVGIDTDTHRFTKIAEACRAVIDDRAGTEVETEVTR
jgi:hypothetical protein